jgi:hypothetical protein
MKINTVQIEEKIEVGDVIKTLGLQEKFYLIVKDIDSDALGLLDLNTNQIDLRYNHILHIVNHFKKHGALISKIIKAKDITINI